MQLLTNTVEGSAETTVGYDVLVAGTYSFAGYLGHLAGSGTATVRLRDSAGTLLASLAIAGVPSTASASVVIAATTAVYITVSSSITNGSDGVAILALELRRSL